MYGDLKSDIIDGVSANVAKRVIPVASSAAAAASVMGSLTMLLFFIALTSRRSRR